MKLETKTSTFWNRLITSTENEKSRRFIAGSISGTTAAVILQPFDVIRTFQQGTFTSNINLSTTNTCLHIIQQNNIFALWRGLSPTLIRIFCGAGIYFVTLNHLLALKFPTSRSSLSFTISSDSSSSTKRKSNTQLFISGAIARTIAGGILAPFTVMKAQMEWQIDKQSLYRNLINAFKYDGGMHGLYRGFGVTILRDVPFSGLYVLFYKRLQDIMQNKLELPDIISSSETFINLISGLTAGILATTITHPLDVVKTRIQLSRFETNEKSKTSLNTIEIIRKIGKYDGYLEGFSRGIVPRVLKRTFSTAITWTVYESIAKQLNLNCA